MDDSMPKYLNSPETPVYSKSRILYGLHISKQHCRRENSVFIVEGYFDFLSLYQNGVQNTVASLGTALTSEHVRLLKGYASNMILVFDSDNAGVNAAKRSITTFVKHGIDVRILVLPKGEDPDSFIRKYGKDEFKKAADKAMSIINFLSNTAIKKYGLSIEGRINILDEMKFHLAAVEDSAARSLYVRELSEILGIDEKAVLEKVRQAIEKKNGQISVLQVREKFQSSDPAMEMGKKLESDRREMQILSLMLQYSEIRAEIRSRSLLDFFYSERLKKIGKLIESMQCPEKTFTVNVMAEAENDEDRELIASLAMTEIPCTSRLKEKSLALMDRIVKVRSRAENFLANKIKKAEQNGSFDLPLELLEKRQREIRKMHGYE